MNVKCMRWCMIIDRRVW